MLTLALLWVDRQTEKRKEGIFWPLQEGSTYYEMGFGTVRLIVNRRGADPDEAGQSVTVGIRSTHRNAAPWHK
jgi:hypothetical protein